MELPSGQKVISKSLDIIELGCILQTIILVWSNDLKINKNLEYRTTILMAFLMKLIRSRMGLCLDLGKGMVKEKELTELLRD